MAAKPSTAVNTELTEPMSIEKPTGSILDACKSTKDPNIGSVKELLTGLPHYRLSEAKDWARLHPDEGKYWSPEYCFVHVPILGARDTLHFIAESLAVTYLPSGRIQRFRLALATKPHNSFFLCHVPSQNLDNLYNKSNLEGCRQAQQLWTQLVSRRDEGIDGYKVMYSRDPDAFPDPEWPEDPLSKIIEVTFANRIILTDDHPALFRLIGARQSSE
jgi:hypothetical protein